MDFFEQERIGTDQALSLDAPLADRMRPRSFEQFVGQAKIIGPGKPLRKAIDEDAVSSIIFWGPPGSGKTTIARLIAHTTRGQFIPFSAVTSSIKEVKEVLSKAANYRAMSGRRTYLFIDEIHRFNKAQQDAFLPYVEKGDIVLIGATTENPSFEVNSALLSRMRVYVLDRLTEEDLCGIITQALTDEERGLGKMQLAVEEAGMQTMAVLADGDARRALTMLEAAAAFVGSKGTIDAEIVRQISDRTILQYDRDGEEHYNIISALHKTIRDGDPDAALYWLARMLKSGEDPLYVARRLVRFASEDVGLADPFALTLALSAREAYHQLGSPEGELALAELVVYLACAPKSNSVYIAFGKAMSDAERHGSLPVPLWLRNAPTRLMKELDYGKDYKYAHDFAQGMTDQEHFPTELKGTRYYQPTQAGREARNAEYLARYLEYRRQADKKKKD